MDQKLTTTRKNLETYLTGEFTNLADQAKTTTTANQQKAAQFLTASMIPSLFEKGTEFEGWMRESASRVEEQFTSNIEMTTTNVRDVIDGLKQNFDRTVDQLNGAVSDVEQLMTQVSDKMEDSAQSVTTVMEAMSTVSETASLGLSSVTETLDDLQSIFRNIV